jgi:hypothetical protein
VPVTWIDVAVLGGIVALAGAIWACIVHWMFRPGE